ncbi:MAG: DUF6514 family protein [Clostridiales bacterium]|jgi:hypothetical protein|nr:DUF6514 family protein [Clostridiales bacterium]
MVKELIASKEYLNLNKQKVILDYYITETLADESTVFGVEIESFVKYTHSQIIKNYEQAPKVSYSYSRMKGVINYLANNLVSPMILQEVLDDYFDDEGFSLYSFDYIISQPICGKCYTEFPSDLKYNI